jgi:hypothetical protein
MMVVAGLCWIAFALVIGLFLFTYLVGGAGLQVFGFLFGMSSTTVVIGLVHFVGFVAAACLCFVIGVGLCAHGLVPAPEPEKRTAPQPRERFAFLRRLIASMPTHEAPEAALRCVCCRVALATPVHICPDCGWTQPHYHNA